MSSKKLYSTSFNGILDCLILKVTLINCIYPSPVSAQHAWICHPWLRMDWRLRSFEISAALKQPLTSCLLAKTKILALLSSSWPIILCNSSLVMLNLSRSVESTTKITNWTDMVYDLISCQVYCVTLTPKLCIPKCQITKM